MFDAIVIGAGSSGSHVADRLARFGRRVLVLEKKPAAGLEVCCTGIIGRECLELLELDSGLVLRQARSARFFSPSGRSLRLTRDEPVAFVLDRGTLDRTLMARAVASGAEYEFSSQVSRIEPRETHVRLTVARGGEEAVLETKTVVIASGYDTTLPRSIGLGRISDCLIGAQAEVRLEQLEEVEVYVDPQLAPGGFAWLVPTGDGSGLAGLVTRRQHERRLGELLTRLRARGKIASTDCCRSYGAIPIRPLPRTFTDRVLVVGDAAGQVKPTTGGGIYYGLLCGAIAAEVLHRGLETGQLSATHLATYQHRWRRRLGRELAIGYLAHCLWHRLNDRHVETLFDLASSRGISELIATSRAFSFDWHGPLLLQMAGLFPFTPRGLDLPSTWGGVDDDIQERMPESSTGLRG